MEIEMRPVSCIMGIESCTLHFFMGQELSYCGTAEAGIMEGMVSLVHCLSLVKLKS